MNSINHQRLIQPQQCFTGRIAFVRRVKVENGEVTSRPLKTVKNRVLRPLINHIKSHRKGTYGIAVQRNPDLVHLISTDMSKPSMVSEFSKKGIRQLVDSMRSKFSKHHKKKTLCEKIF